MPAPAFTTPHRHRRLERRRPTAPRWGLRPNGIARWRAGLVAWRAGLAGCLASLALPAAAAAQAGTPPGWRAVADAPPPGAGGSGTPVVPASFAVMPPGWHVTTGSATVLYPEGGSADGRFRVESEVFLFPDAGGEEYGILLGGRELSGGEGSWTAFVLRADGSAAVLRRDAGKARPLAPWTRHEAIATRSAGEPVRNALAVEAGAAEVAFEVNGARVLSLPREEAPMEGAFGFRIGAGMNLHITTLDVTRRYAPPRRTGQGG